MSNTGTDSFRRYKIIDLLHNVWEKIFEIFIQNSVSKKIKAYLPLI